MNEPDTNKIMDAVRRRAQDEATIRQAAGVLNRSQRGREVLRDLRNFLAGPAAALDEQGQTAVQMLLVFAWCGKFSSVQDHDFDRPTRSIDQTRMSP